VSRPGASHLSMATIGKRQPEEVNLPLAERWVLGGVGEADKRERVWPVAEASWFYR